MGKESIPSPKKKSGSAWLVWILIGSIIFWAGALFSAELGYRQGQSNYKNWEAVEIARFLDEQYNLGIQDLQNNRYDLARQRFEYILQYDPNFPGALVQLENAVKALRTAEPFTPPVSAYPTSTVISLQTLQAIPQPSTPTPDSRAAEMLFTQAISLANSQDWEGVVKALESLRGVDLAYRVVDVDGLLYLAFRNRGVQKIQVDGNLGGGIYDLTLAERFGPLDSTAFGLRDLARLYLYGLSFWEVHPNKAVYYFGQVASAAAYLHDSTGWTAKERYRASLLQYAQALASSGKWCAAQAQYELALSVRDDGQLGATVTYAQNMCSPVVTVTSTTGEFTLTPTTPSPPSTTEPPATTEVPTTEVIPTTPPVVTTEPPVTEPVISETTMAGFSNLFGTILDSPAYRP